MDELQKLLSDPAALEQAARMAQQLLGGGGPEAQSPPPAPPRSLPLGGLGELLGKGGGGHPLSAALGPYLDEGRRRRLERALTAAKTLRLSGSLLGRERHEL